MRDHENFSEITIYNWKISKIFRKNYEKTVTKNEKIGSKNSSVSFYFLFAIFVSWQMFSDVLRFYVDYLCKTEKIKTFLHQILKIKR
jgi:hypothetical protein